MIAPEPFFEPRGTPFSEYHRIRALLDLGHTVDLVTYPFGSDVVMPGLRIFRAARPPFIKRVRIGPSAAKVFLDIALTCDRAQSCASRPVRRRPLARRGCRDRRGDFPHSRHSTSLRHALQPAAAIGEFRVQQFIRVAVDVSGARTDSYQTVARHDRDLPASGGDGEESRSWSPYRAHRERARVG